MVPQLGAITYNFLIYAQAGITSHHNVIAVHNHGGKVVPVIN